MVYIGIDGSTTSYGVGVLKDKQLIHYECIKPKSKDWEERVRKIAIRLNEILHEYPDIECAFMEDIPLKDGKITIKKLGCVRGATDAILALNDIPINPQSVSDWRRNALFYDGTKAGLQRDAMKQKAVDEVKNLFDIDVNDDIAEAILVGYRTLYPKEKKRVKGFRPKQ